MGTYTNATEWAAAIQRDIQGIIEKNTVLFKEIAKQTFMEIVMRTPVGIGASAGNTVASWRVGVNSKPANTTTSGKDPTKKNTVDKIFRTIDNAKDPQAFYLSNASEWIWKLEYGEPNTDKGYPSPVERGSLNVETGEYEIRTEDGKSKYILSFDGPYGMVRGTIAMFDKIVSDAIDKYKNYEI